MGGVGCGNSGTVHKGWRMGDALPNGCCVIYVGSHQTALREYARAINTTDSNGSCNLDRESMRFASQWNLG
jgi:hypothetical protein